MPPVVQIAQGNPVVWTAQRDCVTGTAQGDRVADTAQEVGNSTEPMASDLLIVSGFAS